MCLDFFPKKHIQGVLRAATSGIVKHHILVSFDVKRMFMSLPHGEIEEAVLGFIQMTHAEFESPCFHLCVCAHTLGVVVR